jgi:RNase H-fold protein (predicted Holliday junction resolvase)
MAFPHGDIDNDASFLMRLSAIAKEKSASHVVMGDAKSSGGHANTVTDEVHKMAQKIEALGLTVHMQNELWSSIEASRYAPEGGAKSDSAAAAVILQRYLDAQANPQRPVVSDDDGDLTTFEV